MLLIIIGHLIETKLIVGRIKTALLERLDIGQSHKRWPLRIIGHLVEKKKISPEENNWTFCKEKNLGGEKKRKKFPGPKARPYGLATFADLRDTGSF